MGPQTRLPPEAVKEFHAKAVEYGAKVTEMPQVPRILILVLSVDQEPWRTIERDGQRATWAGVSLPNVHVVFCRGRQDGIERRVVRVVAALTGRAGLPWLRAAVLRSVGRRHAMNPVTNLADGILRVGVPETYVTIGAKTYAALRHVVAKYSFDFLLRTNTSSFVNVAELVHLAEGLPRNRMVGGVPMVSKKGVPFLSGAGILMSRDVAEAIASDPDFDFSAPDDVALTQAALKAGGADQVVLNRVDVRSLDDVEALTPEALAETFHYRCKVVHNRRADAAVMQRLHERLALLTMMGGEA